MTADAQNCAAMDAAATLSSRSRQYSQAPEWIEAYIRCITSPYDAETNPDGIINLGVAENTLSHDIIAERLRHVRRSMGDHPELFGYTAASGIAPLKKQLKWLLDELVFKGEAPVDFDDMLATNGSGSAIELLFLLLLDAGQSVLVPQPYYHGFDNDIKTRFGGNIIPVPMDLKQVEPGVYEYELDVASLDVLFEQHGGAANVRAFLWTNPNNPTGQIFSEEQTLQLLRWSLARDIHFVTDEVYALSVFPSAPRHFVSAYALAHRHAQELGGLAKVESYVHFIWSFSKDFSLNGYRLGLIVSRNRPLHQRTATVGYFAGASSDTQMLMAEMISDRDWVRMYLRENTKRLEACYERCAALVRGAGWGHVKGCSGMFLWFNPLINGPTEERTPENEKKVWLKILDAGVYMAAGFILHAREGDAGWLRCCFSCAKPDALEVGFKRILGAVSGSNGK